jgi:hypothetical protein
MLDPPPHRDALATSQNHFLNSYRTSLSSSSISKGDKIMAIKLSGKLTTYDADLDGPHNTLVIQVGMSKINNAQALNGKTINVIGEN